MKIGRLDAKVLFILAFLMTDFGILGVTPGACMDKGNALSHLDSPFGFIDHTEAEDFYSELSVYWRTPADGRMMGILWNQIEHRPGAYDFSKADEAILKSFRKGINLAIHIIPINNNYIRPGRGRAPYPKGHMKELGRFIEKFVERYDGDGIDDAPSSPVIKLYQFWHELGPRARRRYWASHVEEYIEVFKVIYESMKSACPDCKLLLAGATLKEDYSFKGEEVYDRRGRRTVLEDGFHVKVLKGLNKCCLDIGLDYHTNQILKTWKAGAYLNHKDWIERIKRAYETFGYKNLDIVSMSTSAPDWDGKTEQEQARYLIKSYILSLALGQKKLFWTSSLEYYWPHKGREAFAHTGLINNPRNDGKSQKKLAYYTYRLMVEKLDGAQWNKTRILSMGKDNIYAFQFVKKGRPVYVIWWDYFKEPGFKTKTFTLKGIGATEVRITTATPIAEKGLEVKDYGKAFKLDIRKVDSGKVYLKLDTEPLVVEIRG